jgi:hypothetical protein
MKISENNENQWFCSNSPHATTKKRVVSPTVKAQHARFLTLFAGKRVQVAQVYRGSPQVPKRRGNPTTATRGGALYRLWHCSLGVGGRDKLKRGHFEP